MVASQERPTPEGGNVPALPAPEPSLDEVTKVCVRLDDLGPMVVNSDGVRSMI